jgi:hypothetical protein
MPCLTFDSTRRVFTITLFTVQDSSPLLEALKWRQGLDVDETVF